jgi:TPR repeat protein
MEQEKKLQEPVAWFLNRDPSDAVLNSLSELIGIHTTKNTWIVALETLVLISEKSICPQPVKQDIHRVVRAVLDKNSIISLGDVSRHLLRVLWPESRHIFLGKIGCSSPSVSFRAIADRAIESQKIDWNLYFALLQKSSDLGLPSSCFAYAESLLVGENIQKDLTKAAHYSGMALSKGYPGSFCQLGRIRLVQGREKEAVDFWQRGVAYNEGSSCNQLGDYYVQNKNLKKEAIPFYRKAAELFDPKGMMHYGLTFLDDAFGQKDLKTGMAILDQAADLGSTDILEYIGEFYEFGDHLPKDQVKALGYYAKGKALGSGYCLWRWCHLNTGVGEGIDPDYEQARDGLAKLLAGGYGCAAVDMARLYSEGRGVAKSDETAARFLTFGAWMKNADSLYLLAEKYRTGEGVIHDSERAFRYYIEAGKQGIAKGSRTGFGNE